MAQMTIFVQKGQPHFRNNEGTFTLGEITTRALSAVPEALRSTMDQVRTSEGGNVLLSFGNKAYPSNDSGKTQEENNQRRSLAIAQRFVVIGHIIAELARMGVPLEQLSARDSYPSKGGGFSPTTQLWLNVTAQGTVTAKTVMTDEELLTKAMLADEEKCLAILGDWKDGELGMFQRVRLKALILSNVEAVEAVEAIPQEPEADEADGDQMPD